MGLLHGAISLKLKRTFSYTVALLHASYLCNILNDIVRFSRFPSPESVCLLKVNLFCTIGPAVQYCCMVATTVDYR